MARLIDIDSITETELWEVGRRAVEDVLVEMRDSNIGILGRNNGLVIKTREGEPSNIIRMSIEDAIMIGITAIINHRLTSPTTPA